MKEFTAKQQIAILGAFLYTLIIGVGMYLSFHINGIDYSKPELVNTLWLFEIILTLLTVGLIMRYFSWREIGFVPLDRKQFLWVFPSLIIVLLMWIGICSFLKTNVTTTEELKLFFLVGFTTLLVGLSEELMYRGIVLSAFLQNEKKNSGKAVLISAITFSLLHSVNIFAGLPLTGVVGQLILTFMLGLLFGLLRLRLKNIIPFIIFHWLWDFALIGASIFSYEGNGILTLFFLLHEIILIVILLYLLRKDKVNRTCDEVNIRES